MGNPQFNRFRITSLVTSFWNFLQQGIPPKTTYLQRRSLQLMRVGVCLALMANLLILLGYTTGATGILSLVNVILSTCIYGLSLTLMLKARNVLGRNIFAVALIAMTWHLCLVVAPQSQTILFFIPLSIGGTLLWSGQRVKQVLYALIAVAWYLISAYTVSHVYSNGKPLAADSLNPSLIFNMVVVFGATFLIAAANEETASNLQAMLINELQRNQKLLADAMPVYVLSQLANQGDLAHIGSPNASFIIIDLVNIDEYERCLSATEVLSLTSELLSRLSFFADRYNLEQVRTEGYAMVAIAKQDNLGDQHPNVATEFAIAVRNSLAQFTGKRGHKLQFRIGAASTRIMANNRISLAQIQKAWGMALDVVSRLEASAPLNQIHIDGEMKTQLDSRLTLSPNGRNYVVA